MRIMPATAAAVWAMLQPVPAGATIIDTPSQCAQTAELSACLRDRAEETGDEPVRLDDRRATQLWRSEGGATWTLVLIDAAGTACVVAFGRRLDREPGKEKGETL